METIGIKKLRENLNEYIYKVKAGEKIVITDRKKEIAVITPIEKNDNEDKIYQMVQHGTASWSGSKPSGMPVRVKSKGKSLSSAVIEDRG